jgi:hypothetical protein
MKRLLDHDPMTGITEYFHEDSQTGEWAIETVQDVRPSMEAARDMRNDPKHTKQGIKAGMWHYAHLDNVIITKMINEDGIDPYSPNDQKKLGQLLETKYKYCKVTDGYHKFKS